MTHLRLAFRRLRQAPAFACTALATIAICLGANLAMFAVVDGILLRPLPFPDSGRLVTLVNTYAGIGVERDGASLTNYYERRGQLAALASLSLVRETTAVVGDTGTTREEPVLRVSPDFLATVGRTPALGRSFHEAETLMPVAQHAVILSDAYWRQHFGADPKILGQALRVNGAVRTIVGVLPPDFRFLSAQPRLLLPLTSTPEQRAPTQRHAGGAGTLLLGRLRPGATLVEAQAQVDAHNAALERTDSGSDPMAAAGFRTRVMSLHADHVREIRPTLWLMQGGALCLLLAGLVNLVNLLLVRASAQQKEAAVRRALGAGRGQVVRQALAETLLLTLPGGLLGLLVGAAGTRLLAVLGAERLPLGATMTFDGAVAALGFAAAVVLGLLIAVPIAWSRLRSLSDDTLRTETRTGTTGRAARRLRHGFIVVQIALAFVLLAGATLLMLSLDKLQSVSTGFRAEQVVTGQFLLPYAPFPPGSTRRVAVLERLIETLDRQPGVMAAGTVTNVPLSESEELAAFVPRGQRTDAVGSVRGQHTYGVAGDYFTALGIPLREGRFLDSDDALRADRICVVDEEFARRHWPGRSALGQQIEQGSGAERAAPFTIVGVVGSVRQLALTEVPGQGAVYLPYRWRENGNIYIVTRTRQHPEAFAHTLRSALQATDPELAIDDIRTLQSRIDDSLVGRRSPALLGAIIAAVALLLAAIGTYGVLAFTLSQRQREIGIRIALGARASQVRTQFLVLGLQLLAAGLVLGVIGAWFCGQALRGLLYGVPAFHPGTLLATALILSLVALLACLAPVRRATRVDPQQVLGAA